jgi:CMP-N-acetylneuraminic acid synthetase
MIMKKSKKIEEKNADHVKGHRFLSTSLDFLKNSASMKKRIAIKGEPKELKAVLANPNCDSSEMRRLQRKKHFGALNL